MMKLTVLLVLSVLSVAFSQNLCNRMYNQCNFKIGMTNKIQTFNIKGPQDRAFTPRIRSKSSSMMVGVLNSNGRPSEFVFQQKSYPLTNFGAPTYAPYHFKPYTIKGSRGSGIGHQTFTGNQKQFARYRCVRVFFSHYQVFNDDGTVNNVVKNPTGFRDCVVFKTI